MGPTLLSSLARRTLVLVHDFTTASLSVLPAGLTLAERTGGAVHLVHVLPGADAATGPWRAQQAQARLAALRLHYRHVLLGRAPFYTAVLGGADGAVPDLATYARVVAAGLAVVPPPGPAPEALPCPVLTGPTLLLLLAQAAPEGGGLLPTPARADGDGVRPFAWPP